MAENEELEQELEDTVERIKNVIEQRKTEIMQLHEEIDALEEKNKNLEETLRRREELAMEKIAQSEADAVREVRAISVEIAVDATRVLIAQKLDGSHADALVNEAISDLSQKLH